MAAIKIDKIARRYLDASSGTPPHQFMFCLYLGGQILLSMSYFQNRNFDTLLTRLQAMRRIRLPARRTK